MNDTKSSVSKSNNPRFKQVTRANVLFVGALLFGCATLYYHVTVAADVSHENSDPRKFVSRVQISLVDGVTNNYEKTGIELCSEAFGTDIVVLARQAVLNILARTNTHIQITDTNRTSSDSMLPPKLIQANEGALLGRLVRLSTTDRYSKLVTDDLYRCIDGTNVLDWIHWSVLEMHCSAGSRNAASLLLRTLLGMCTEGASSITSATVNSCSNMQGQVLADIPKQVLIRFFTNLANSKSDLGTTHMAVYQLREFGLTNGLLSNAFMKIEDDERRLRDSPFTNVVVWPGITNLYYKESLSVNGEGWGFDPLIMGIQAISNIMARTNSHILIADSNSWLQGKDTVTGLMECVEGDLLRRMYEKHAESEDGGREVILAEDLYQCLNESNSLDWFYWASLEVCRSGSGVLVEGVGYRLRTTLLRGVPKKRHMGRFVYMNDSSLSSLFRPCTPVLCERDREVVLRSMERMANKEPGAIIGFIGIKETNNLNTAAMRELEKAYWKVYGGNTGTPATGVPQGQPESADQNRRGVEKERVLGGGNE